MKERHKRRHVRPDGFDRLPKKWKSYIEDKEREVDIEYDSWARMINFSATDSKASLKTTDVVAKVYRPGSGTVLFPLPPSTMVTFKIDDTELECRVDMIGGRRALFIGDYSSGSAYLAAISANGANCLHVFPVPDGVFNPDRGRK